MSDEQISVLGEPGSRPRNAGRSGRGSKRRGRRVVLALVLLASPFIAAAGWFWYQVDSPGDPGRIVTVDIPAGSGVSAIADRLEARGVIGSALAFRFYARISGAPRVQAGRYRLHQHLGARAAIDALKPGPRQRYLKLSLPPGLRFDQIAQSVGALPGLSAQRLTEVAESGVVRSKFQPAGVTSLEGLTWPDTYFVAEHEDETAILRTIVGAFDRHATAAGLGGVSDPYRAVVIASLIQREAGIDADRPLIAGVIENRLRDSMQLQIDATVVYARGGGDTPLTDADFALDSPYNTYRTSGLPPTPISTVTEASVRAAIRPADVLFKYYVLTDASGEHAFAVTFAEHEANIADARRRGVLP